MYWRLGIDLGTNSIGWWAFKVVKDGTGENARWRITESLDGGVGIFPEGREITTSGLVGDSNAVQRRDARSMRRNRDRGNNREKSLKKILTETGLLPKVQEEKDRLFRNQKKTNGDPERFNPYRLRAEALKRPLEPFELGRALANLGKRRGYKSNRKEASDDDGGKLKERIDELHKTLKGRTLGQYLWEAFQEQNTREAAGEKRSGIRFRGENPFYADRSLYEAELAAIRNEQESHHALTPDDWEAIRSKVLDQFPLKPVERGWCEFYTEEKRHWSDTPIGHDFRIYQELNNLKWIDENEVPRPLTSEQRQAVQNALLTRKSEVTFASLKTLKDPEKTKLFPSLGRFNLEGGKRKGLKPHKIAATLQDNPVLAPLWQTREETGASLLDDAFETLHHAEDNAKAVTELVEKFGLTDKQAKALCRLKLSSGTASVSRRFMEEIVPVLRDQGLIYSDAVKELKDEYGHPLHHSLRDDGMRWKRLPYYGEVAPHSMLGADKQADPEHEPEKHFGKINNPSVHSALNALRRLVNTLTDRFGTPPVQIHVEMTRDLKQSRKQRDDAAKQNRANEAENDRIKKFCAEQGFPEPSALDIKKVKLWEELNGDGLVRLCPFSGKPISAAQLFNGEAEIEHLLPFKRTLDDSRANLTVAHRWANRLKGDRSPYEAFGDDQHADKGIVWEEILGRIEALPHNKRWRFGPKAMEKFEQEGGFLARQLTDTAYMARFASRYLRALEGVESVVTIPGRLTAMLRGKWSLNGILSDDNRKHRDNHRHHAVDAAVVALTSRGVLNEISRQSARGATDRLHIQVPDLEPEIRDAIRKRVPEFTVFHKPDHGLAGKFFKETAYGFVDERKRDADFKEHNLVVRKPLEALTPAECKTIRDPALRKKVDQWLYEAKGAGVKHDKALAEFSKEHDVKSVRILVKDQTVAPVPSATHKGYKADALAFCDIWRIPKGKPGNWKPGEYKWEGQFWSFLETAPFIGKGEPDKEVKRPHPAAKFVCRLFKNDMIAVWEKGEVTTYRIGGFSSTNNKLDIHPVDRHFSGHNYKSINTLGGLSLRKLYVTPDGRLLNNSGWSSR